MNKQNMYKYLSALLLLTNLLVIGFIFSSKFTHPHHNGPKDLIIKKLNFDQDQGAKYEELIKWHRGEMNRTQSQMLILKKSLYSKLNSEVSSAEKDSLVNEIGILQTQIERINYKHFDDIKALCRKDQLPAFEKLSFELADLFSPPKRRPGPKDR